MRFCLDDDGVLSRVHTKPSTLVLPVYGYALQFIERSSPTRSQPSFTASSRNNQRVASYSKPSRPQPISRSRLEGIFVEISIPTTGKRIHPDFIGEIYNVRYNDRHEWWYLGDQTSEECLLITCFDSIIDAEGTMSRATPHTSFPSSSPEAARRQFIELR